MKYLCGLDARSLEEAEIETATTNEIIIRFSGKRKNVRIFQPKFENLGNMLVIKGLENAPEGWRAITMYALEKGTP